MCRILNAEGIPFVPGDSKPVYRNPVFEPLALRTPPDCPMAEEACRRTLILRHQVLLGDPEDMDDISNALGKVLEHIEVVKRNR